MRILITCSNPPWKIGGVERVVGETAKRLARENEVTIYTKGATKKTKEWDGVKVKVFKNDFGFLSLNMIAEIRKRLSEFDVVHTHSLSTTIPFETFLAVNNSKLVVSPHYHLVASTRFFNLLRKIYDPIFCKVVMMKAKTIISVSETEKTILKRKFGVKDKKIEVVPNGVDIEAIRNSKAFDLKKRVTLLLYVGRLERYKNVHLIIKSMSYAPEQYKLFIVGAGPYKTKLLQLIEELKLQDKVQILSGLSDEDVFRWYKTCNLVLNLSSQEAFGITLIEGLAAGKPVIVNNQTALREMANKFEQIFAVNAERLSAKELAEQMITKAENGVHKTTDLTGYSWGAITDQIKDLYGSIQ